MGRVVALMLFCTAFLLLGCFFVLGDVIHTQCGSAAPTVSVSVSEGTDSWGRYWIIQGECDITQVHNACGSGSAQFHYEIYIGGIQEASGTMWSFQPSWPKATFTSDKYYSSGTLQVYCHTHYDNTNGKIHDSTSSTTTAKLCEGDYVNACDNTDSIGCTRNTGDYNACDLDSDVSCGDEIGKCDDTVDNDCDGLEDYYDIYDCVRVVCDENVNDGDSCEGNSGDLSNDVNTDDYYCDTNPNPNRCCFIGTRWDSEDEFCTEQVAGCKPDPCDKEPLSAAWWSDSNCITASDGCCYSGTQYGEETYTYQAITKY